MSVLLDQRASKLSDDELYETEWEMRIDLMVAAMKRLDASGLFGTGKERECAVINVEQAPPDGDGAEYDRALRLNPPSALLIRKGCKIVKKGEVYECNLFTAKSKLFKQEDFVDEVKHFYTDLINLLVKDDKEKLHVFDSSGLYFATKKIGKNNPKAEQIQTDNDMRMRWNCEVDREIVSGISEAEIQQIKKKYIADRIRETVQPITEPNEGRSTEIISQTDKTPKPMMSAEAAAYPKLLKIYKELKRQNGIIFDTERDHNELELGRDSLKGFAKLTKKGELQNRIDRKNEEIDILKIGLSGIAKKYGYKNVQDFYPVYHTVKNTYADYQDKAVKWEETYGTKKKSDTIHERIKSYQKEIAEKQSGNITRGKDREAR